MVRASDFYGNPIGIGRLWVRVPPRAAIFAARLYPLSPSISPFWPFKNAYGLIERVFSFGGEGGVRAASDKSRSEQHQHGGQPGQLLRNARKAGSLRTSSSLGFGFYSYSFLMSFQTCKLATALEL